MDPPVRETFPVAGPGVRGWPLVGRAEQLRVLTRALGRGGGSAGVLLAGAAGVGKTRLAREALAATGPEVRTRWAVATASARTVPLGAFATLLGGSKGQPADASLLHRAVRVLCEGAGRVGLGVDDAHLLDPVSATLVHQLALHREVRLVVTLRSGESAPDAVTALWKDGLLDRLELAPLSEVELGVLVESVLGGLLEGRSRRRLFAVTEGNVLLLRHLLDGERAAGRLYETAGLWQWVGEPGITPALGELIDSRIGGLPDRLHEVLEVLAFGEPLGIDLLVALVDRAAIEEVTRHELVTVEPSGRRWEARLAHPLYGEAVRARTGWRCWRSTATCPRIRSCWPRRPPKPRC